ncbi:hypothetical protein SAMN04487926_12135 [Paraburkholderia steynii]|uniref:Helix-turn-helix domain-containing protein n=1 Tax=Paraburkholderia steynii TaxID=1245441 RepID=A0A7Z7FLQ9_9BURK|nr:hypothetical protein [Paraburkholderia steynii]SDI64867.1 hypothetical protein SAMN04487926_12135 [Paraburkholderia steynii]
MSLHHENFAWKVEAQALKKFVLVFLYREALLSTGEGHLQMHKIAHECGMSESAARKFAAELEQEGHFQRLQRPGRGLHYLVTPKVPA